MACKFIINKHHKRIFLLSLGETLKVFCRYVQILDTAARGLQHGVHNVEETVMSERRVIMKKEKNKVLYPHPGGTEKANHAETLLNRFLVLCQPKDNKAGRIDKGK